MTDYDKWIKEYGIEIANQLRDKINNGDITVDKKPRKPSDFKFRQAKKAKRSKESNFIRNVRRRLIYELKSKDIVPVNVLNQKCIKLLLNQLARQFSNIKDMNDIQFTHEELIQTAAIIQNEQNQSLINLNIKK